MRFCDEVSREMHDVFEESPCKVYFPCILGGEPVRIKFAVMFFHQSYMGPISNSYIFVMFRITLLTWTGVKYMACEDSCTSITPGVGIDLVTGIRIPW